MCHHRALTGEFNMSDIPNANYRTYADLMNNYKVELILPEYYTPNLPKYFREPRTAPLPMHNGVPVSHDQYAEIFDGYRKPDEVFPRLIYQSEEMNRTTGSRTVMEILDLMDNKVPFSFKKLEQINHVVLIIKGYKMEMQKYVDYSMPLQKLMSRLDGMISILEPIYDHYCDINRRVNGKIKNPTFLDLLSMLNKG